MRLPRFFVDAPIAPGAAIELEGPDAHHVHHVLRLRTGARVVVVSGGTAYEGEILRASGVRTLVRVDELAADQGGELPVEVVVAQALAKAAKFDDVVEKCVELGAARIVPIRCARDVTGRGDHAQRWRRIARVAAQQSRRRRVPDVTDVQRFGDALAQLSSSHLPLIADPAAPAHSLAGELAAADAARPLALFIGPEGGFSDDERADARRLGGRLVLLGPTTLRTETAAAALLAAVSSLRGWW